jgi:uncharacterized membrane protein YeaQ/YmgE (transglycosylase-associated protein family)
MGIIAWIIIGLIAGWLANLILKGRGGGLFGNLVVGLIGAIVGGWLFGALGIISGRDSARSLSAPRSARSCCC